MLNVGLLFHSSNSDNLGVGALTISQIEILRSISQATGIEIAITLFDWAGTRTPYVQGADVSIVRLTGEVMKAPRRVMNMFRQCDMMVDIGAGDSFSDIYGAKRLSRMMYLKYLVHMSRCPVVLAPQTYGPFTSRLVRPFARDLLKRAVLVAARDDHSTAAVRRLGVTRPVITASDIALQLPVEGNVPVWTRPVIGVNVSGLLMAGGYTGRNQFDLRADFVGTMHELIAQLLGLPERPEVVLVPHVISPSMPSEDDMNAALTIQSRIPEVTVAPAFKSPSAAKAFISSLDFFVGARMHSCIAAFSSDVPVVPLAYSDKFVGLFGSLGFDATLDCRTLGSEALVQSVLSGFRNREALARQVQIARMIGEERLGDYIDGLTRVIGEVALHKRTDAQAQLAVGHRWRAMDERL
ncbi:polysaccharide pyruvyl transferase family protein [uncultured Litoreibacter sp.]|uniref:polysaccharide pyruvyl transferase family protein n=1 Tax=uncultured Litoreibacter sp. TaxID=1392394 RepID=UPI002614EE8D|nr:polysaccharide pyruvyl transferase family protein [uncultured Litoreibacter sp.]